MMADMRHWLFLLALSLAASAAKRPITHEDVWLIKRASSVVVSPNGIWALATVTEPAYDESKSVTDLWIVPVNGAAPIRKLTNTKASESGAVFSPDSTQVAFSAKREDDEMAQIYVLSLAGGEAMRVTSVSTGAVNPKWRPDGRAILFQSRVYPGAEDEDANKKIAAERKARNSTRARLKAFRSASGTAGWTI